MKAKQAKQKVKKVSKGKRKWRRYLLHLELIPKQRVFKNSCMAFESIKILCTSTRICLKATPLCNLLVIVLLSELNIPFNLKISLTNTVKLNTGKMILYDSCEKSGVLVSRSTRRKSLAWKATLSAQRENSENGVVGVRTTGDC